jgi:GNAT superfamily N-acetyltransferase
MDANFSLRAARPEDALCLGVLGTQVFLDTYATTGIRPTLAREVLAAFATARIESLLAQPGMQWIVAECEAHLIGFAQLALGSAHPQVIAEAPAELSRLYVQEPFTGLGVGSALLHAAEALARQAGCGELWLTPWVHNLRALRFYGKRGYADFGAAWFEFEGERHENRVLARHLRPSTPGSPP